MSQNARPMRRTAHPRGAGQGRWQMLSPRPGAGGTGRPGCTSWLVTDAGQSRALPLAAPVPNSARAMMAVIDHGAPALPARKGPTGRG